MLDALIGLTAGIVGADRGDRDADSDPGWMWKLGQITTMIAGVAVAFCVFFLIGGFD